MLKAISIVLGGVFLVSGACGAYGATGLDDDPRLAAMQRELDDLQRQVQEVCAQRDQPWLTERRAQEVKALIREVFKDADSRAALLSDELTGYYDGGFIIRDHGPFLLKINSYMQFRYINSNVPGAADEQEGGFQARRIAMMFSGYIGSPRVSYMILPTVNRSTGVMRFEYGYITYRPDNRWQLLAGQFKAPFHREWLTSATLQPMIERSYVNSLFTSLYVQGVQATRQTDDTRLRLSLHNGTWSWNTEFTQDRTDYALGVRGEWKVFGNWKQFKDTVGWSGDDGLLLGAALQFDRGETGGSTATPDILKYTGDISKEGDGWNLYAAFSARHIDSNGSPGIFDADQWGAVLQGGIFIIPDKVDLYARYEWIDVDGVAFTQSTGVTSLTDNDAAQLVTLGTNFFLRGHQTKLAFDVIYAFNGLPRNDTSTGLRASEGPSTTLRSHVMISF
jgi:Phosphate-selective porin O and P